MVSRLQRQAIDEEKRTDPFLLEADADFVAGGDRVRYSVALGNAQGPFQVDAELWFQPIAYRWAMNLRKYDAMEPRRFVGYYEQTAAGSGVMLARGRR